MKKLQGDPKIKYIFKLIKSGSQDSHSNLSYPITGKKQVLCELSLT